MTLRAFNCSWRHWGPGLLVSSEINTCCGAEAACSSLEMRFSLSSNRLLSWVLLGKDHSSAPTAAEMSPTHQSSLKLQETALQLTPVPHFTFYSVSPLYPVSWWNVTGSMGRKWKETSDYGGYWRVWVSGTWDKQNVPHPQRVAS